MPLRGDCGRLSGYPSTWGWICIRRNRYLDLLLLRCRWPACERLGRLICSRSVQLCQPHWLIKSSKGSKPNMKIQQLQAIKHVHLFDLPHHAQNLSRCQHKFPFLTRKSTQNAINAPSPASPSHQS